MTTVYLALTWGLVLPVLLLICLAADVATGTTLFHRQAHSRVAMPAQPSPKDTL